MVQDIRTTVQDRLRDAGLGSYTAQAGPIIQSLEAREQEIVAGLCEAGRRLGASTEQVQRICRDLGMAVPSPSWSSSAESNVTPMPQQGSTAQESSAPRSLEALVDALSERVDTLTRRVDAAIEQAGLRL